MNAAGLKSRIAELEGELAGRPDGLVLMLRDGGERTISGTTRHFFRLAELLTCKEHCDEERANSLFPGRQLELAEADLCDIRWATAMDGSKAQLFGLLATLAQGPAEEGSGADGQAKPAAGGATAPRDPGSSG